MKYTGKKIRRLAASGEAAKIVRLYAVLRRRLAEKSRLLYQQADIAANLRHAFMETELDRDRLSRMCKELVELCRSKGFGSEAEKRTQRYGGIDAEGEVKVIG